MTEKRFTLIYGDENPFEWDLMDNQKDCLIVQGNGTAICDLLNELHDENKELRSDRNYWKTLSQSLAKTMEKGDVE